MWSFCNLSFIDCYTMSFRTSLYCGSVVLGFGVDEMFDCNNLQQKRRITIEEREWCLVTCWLFWSVVLVGLTCLGFAFVEYGDFLGVVWFCFVRFGRLWGRTGQFGGFGVAVEVGHNVIAMQVVWTCA